MKKFIYDKEEFKYFLHYENKRDKCYINRFISVHI